jgi:hypothetical protein
MHPAPAPRDPREAQVAQIAIGRVTASAWTRHRQSGRPMRRMSCHDSSGSRCVICAQRKAVRALLREARKMLDGDT